MNEAVETLISSKCCLLLHVAQNSFHVWLHKHYLLDHLKCMQPESDKFVATHNCQMIWKIIFQLSSFQHESCDDCYSTPCSSTQVCWLSFSLICNFESFECEIFPSDFLPWLSSLCQYWF